jgi:hypothetical protein
MIESTTTAPQSNNPNTTNVNLHETDLYLLHVPFQLQGYRCYSDASLAPDHQGMLPRQALCPLSITTLSLAFKFRELPIYLCMIPFIFIQASTILGDM